MVLGFISLILTFGQNHFAKICVSSKVADSMLPCRLDSDSDKSSSSEEEHRRRLLWLEHRHLASLDSSTFKCKEVSTYSAGIF